MALRQVLAAGPGCRGHTPGRQRQALAHPIDSLVFSLQNPGVSPIGAASTERLLGSPVAQFVPLPQLAESLIIGERRNRTAAPVVPG
jgi:hypothetical protein